MSSAPKQSQSAPPARAANAAHKAAPFFAPNRSRAFLGQATEAPFFKPAVQPKLAVGRADDAYEREADATADRVMRIPLSGSVRGSQTVLNVQTKPEEREKDIQKKAAPWQSPIIRLKAN